MFRVANFREHFSRFLFFVFDGLCFTSEKVSASIFYLELAFTLTSVNDFLRDLRPDCW